MSVACTFRAKQDSGTEYQEAAGRGSGVIPMSKPQLTTVLCPPLEKSAQKVSRFRSGWCVKRLQSCRGWVVSNSDGSDCGSMCVRPTTRCRSVVRQRSRSRRNFVIMDVVVTDGIVERNIETVSEYPKALPLLTPTRFNSTAKPPFGPRKYAYKSPLKPPEMSNETLKLSMTRPLRSRPQ